MTPEEEKEEQEGFLHGFHKIPDGNTLSNMLDIELASWQANSNNEIVRAIVAEKEWQRRARLEQDQFTKANMERQNEINTSLVEKQVKWIKFSAILTAVATLAAGIAGSLVTYMLTTESQKQTKATATQQINQPHIETSTSASHPGKKPDKVPLSPPK